VRVMGSTPGWRHEQPAGQQLTGCCGGQLLARLRDNVRACAIRSLRHGKACRRSVCPRAGHPLHTVVLRKATIATTWDTDSSHASTLARRVRTQLRGQLCGVHLCGGEQVQAHGHRLQLSVRVVAEL